MGKIEWSSPAKDDLYEIHSRISKDSLRFADAFIDEIISKVFLLEKHPRIGKRILRVDHDALRELLI